MAFYDLFFTLLSQTSALFPSFYLPLSILLTWWSVVLAVLVALHCFSNADCHHENFLKFYRNHGGGGEHYRLKEEEAARQSRARGAHLLTYERLPVVYDEHCDDLTGRHVYLFQLWYGERSKRFFFPSTTITVSFLRLRKREEGEELEKEATLVLRTRLLCENHRRNLWSLPSDFSRFRRVSHDEMMPTQPPMSLYVLYKRKQPLSTPPVILFDHNQHNSTLILYSVLLLQLCSAAGEEQLIFGCTVDRAMECLQEYMGLPPSSSGGSGKTGAANPPSAADVLAILQRQTFSLACLGRYTGTPIGPRSGLSFAECLLFVLLGESVLVALVTSLLIQCPPPGSGSLLDGWCHHNTSEAYFSQGYQRQHHQQQQLKMSTSEATAIYGALAAVVTFITLSTVYSCTLKRLNARRMGVGFISVVMRAMPAVLLIFCAVSDCSSLYLLAIFSSSFTSFPSSSSTTTFQGNGSSALPPPPPSLLPPSPPSPPSSLPSVTESQHRLLLLWSLAAVLSTLTYLLASALLLMVLYLRGYYDAVPLPPLTMQSLAANVHSTTATSAAGSATGQVDTTSTTTTTSSNNKSSRRKNSRKGRKVEYSSATTTPTKKKTKTKSTVTTSSSSSSISPVHSKLKPYDSTSSLANLCIASSLIVQQLKEKGETSSPTEELKKRELPQTMSKVIRHARFRQEREKEKKGGKGT